MSARATTVLLCLALVACAPPESPSSDPAPAVTSSTAETPRPSSPARDIADRIEASKSGLRTETREQTQGGFDVSQTWYFVGNALVLIEEVVGPPGSLGSAAAYYFDDERLVFFRGRGVRTFVASDGTRTDENFNIEIGYDPEGNVVDAVKFVDGQPSDLEPLDYEAPKARARMFLAEKPGA